MKVKPSKREKKRYLVYKLTGETVTFQKAKSLITDALHYYLGAFGVEKAQPRIFQNIYDAKKQIGIVRVTNKSCPEVRKALNQTYKNIQLSTLGISGTIKKAKNKFMINKL